MRLCWCEARPGAIPSFSIIVPFLSCFPTSPFLQYDCSGVCTDWFCIVAYLGLWCFLVGSRTSLMLMEHLRGSRSPPSPYNTHMTWQVKSYEKNTFLLDIAISYICKKWSNEVLFCFFGCRGLSGALDPSACWGLSPSCSMSPGTSPRTVHVSMDLHGHCNSIPQTRAGSPKSESSAAGIALFSSANWQQQWFVIKCWVVTDVWALMMNTRV